MVVLIPGDGGLVKLMADLGISELGEEGFRAKLGQFSSVTVP